jgi:hypothetical protein
MENRVPTVSLDVTEIVGVLVTFGLAPLLELDENVRRCAGLGMHSCEERIDPLARQRQLELGQHLDLTQPGITKIVSEHGEASLPRSDLGLCCASAEREGVLLGELLRQSSCLSLGT